MGGLVGYEQLVLWRFIPNPLELSWSDTWLLVALPVLGAVVLAVASLVVWYGQIALQRVRWYAHIYAEAQVLQQRADTLSTQLTAHQDLVVSLQEQVGALSTQLIAQQEYAASLGRHLAIYVRQLERNERTFRITGAIRTDDRVFLILERKQRPRLRPGDRLWVVDPRGGEILGMFTMIRVSADGYFVGEAFIASAFWWGHVCQCAATHVPLQTTAVAFLVPREE